DITGTNDDPVFAPARAAGSVDEIGLAAGTAPLTGSTTPDTASGVLTYTDPDRADTGHAASVSYVAGSAVWSGGTAIPSPTLADLAPAMTVQLTTESTNGASGTVTWTATLPDKDLDVLAEGETLSATYNVTVSDTHGGSGTEQVVVTFKGANDDPTITSGTAS